MPRSSSSSPAFSITGMSLFEPMTMPTSGASTSSSSNIASTSVSARGTPSPLAHASTLSTARAAMSCLICLPSNSTRSAAA